MYNTKAQLLYLTVTLLIILQFKEVSDILIMMELQLLIWDQI